MTNATVEPVAKDDKTIGRIPCPVCRADVALKLSKKQRVYVVHSGCCQVFTRSDDADEKLRALIVSAPAPAAPSPSKPTQGDKDKPAPPVERSRDTWDFLS